LPNSSRTSPPPNRSSLANIVRSLLLTVPFPLFATYKALKSPTIDSLAPLLTFYAVLSVLHLLESTVLLPFTYLPLYSWARLAVHVYLCLPPPQGAVAVYNTYVHPFLATHEADIEEGVARLHDRAKVAGIMYARQAADWFRVHILGADPLPPPPPPAAPPSYYGSYAQQLLARFYSTSSTGAVPGRAPAAAPQAAAQSDLYSTLLSTLRLSSTGGLAGQSVAQGLIPRDVSSPADRLHYVRQAQDGLRALTAAFAKEEGGLLGGADETDGGALTKNRSEADFDRIERDEASPDRSKAPLRSSSGGWMPWAWSAGQAAPEGGRDEGKKDEGPVEDVPAVGISSGVDLGTEEDGKRR
jgi:receptor expression-enhancing protein 1/2/3/4